MTKQEWGRVAVMLAAAYPNEPMTPPQLELYGRLLEPYPAAAVETAVEAHIAASRFFPRVSELLDRLRAAETPAVLTPEAAWEEIQQALVRYGPYQPHPPWSHPAVAAAVQAVGGILALAEMDHDALGVARAHVYRHVRAWLDRERAEREAAPIRRALGLPERAALPAAPAAPSRPAPGPASAPAQDVLATIREALARLGRMPGDP